MSMLKDEEELLDDMPIIVNDLKIFKYEDNLEEGVEAIMHYITSSQGREEIEYYKQSEGSDLALFKEFNKLVSFFMTQSTINDENPSLNHITRKINLGWYYSLINDENNAYECFDESLENSKSLVQTQTNNIEGRKDNKGSKLQNLEFNVEDVESVSNIMSLAISLNNKAIIDMKKGNYEPAMKHYKKWVTLIEPLIFSQIKSSGGSSAKNEEPEFLEKLQVLLIIYFNMGVTQLKLENKKYAKVIFEHGWKMARKLMGEGSFFERKFFIKINQSFSSHPRSRHHLKSTHISYIEDHEEKAMDDKSKELGRPNSSKFELERKIEVEEQIIKKRGSRMTDHISKEETDSNNIKVISKTNKRKIFLEKQMSKDLNQSTNSDIVEPKENISRIDEDKIKEVMEKAKAEADARSEAKMKEIMEQFNKTQQQLLGMLHSFY